MKASLLSSLALSALSAGVVVLAIGCAGAPENDTAGDSEVTSADLATAAPRILSVTGNGQGCAFNNLQSEVSADGASVTVSFPAYDAAVGPGSALRIVDCTLLVKVDGASRYQYTLGSIESHGTASIEGEPRTAQQTVSYGFMGSGASNGTQTLDLTTAADDGAFAFVRQNDPAHAVWSPCTAVRDLEVTNRLWLANNDDRSAVVRATESSLKLGLRFRRC